MIKLLGTKRQYHICVYADNGRCLTSSETFKTRRSAVENALAQLKAFGGVARRVVDISDNARFDYVVTNAGGISKHSKIIL